MRRILTMAATAVLGVGVLGACTPTPITATAAIVRIRRMVSFALRVKWKAAS